MNHEIRVRFAPSPTGNLHVGGARTALFNWLFARHNKGRFILRIEDTDAERSKNIYPKAILSGLQWLGIDWDEGPQVGGDYGPYFQTQRVELYRQAVDELLKKGKLYHCFCTPECLEKMREEQAERKLPLKYDGRCRALPADEINRRISTREKFVLRLKVPDGENVQWDDLSKGPLSFSSDLLDDLVVVKSDGLPTYNFAVVVDDTAMKISHVIRGEDHISNTPKQILIYKAMEHPLPFFAHIPMILGSDRSRLSKRHGATSVIDYREMGYEPEAFRNFLALLGWSPENGKEILSPQEMFDFFRIERISSHGAIFNIEKLKWMNSEYIKLMSETTLFEKLKPWLQRVPGFPGTYTDERLKKMVGLFRERIKTYDEIMSHIDWFFEDPREFDAKGLEKVKKTVDCGNLCQALVLEIESLADFSETALEQNIRQFAERNGKKAGEIISIVRLGLSGKTATPGLFESMAVLGKDLCLARLRKFADFLTT